MNLLGTVKDRPIKESKTDYGLDRCECFLQSVEGKTIRLTALMIDIVNSTEKVKTLSAETAGEYYQQFIESTSDFIEQYGGYILKNVGDCVIGIFPCSRYCVENHDKAVLCGLAVRDMIKGPLNSYYLKKGLPSIACRISADFGEARALRIGSSGGYSSVDLFGFPMNSVAKILHRAMPNQMVIGDKLFWELLHMNFSFRLLNRWDPSGKYAYPAYLVDARTIKLGGVHVSKFMD